MAAWYECWIIKINELKTQAIFISHQIRPSESLLILNGQNFPFVNSVKYLGVFFDKKMTWKVHLETTEARAFRTFIRICPPFRSEQLSTVIKFTLL
jgi:hypothetical protein